MTKFLIYAVIFLLLFVGYIKYIESRSVFFPTKNIDLTPENVNIAFEDVYFKTANGIQLHGWFIPFDTSPELSINSERSRRVENAQATILFCHGNGGNISHRVEKILFLRKACANIFIFDYRGYGNSQGRPSEKGIYQDTRAAYDYLIEVCRINPEDIILYGESLGCAAAIDLASQVKTGGLILEGAFSSGKDMARIIYPFLPTALFFNKFNSLSKIKDVSEPKLFIHSRSDEIVPYDLAKKLFNEASDPKQFAEIRGGHNTAFIDSQEDYTGAIVAFIEELKQ